MSERNSTRPQGEPAIDPLGRHALEQIEQMQAELADMRDQLAWSNRLGQIGMLTAAMAHEINNFLTPIRSYAQLALANPDDHRLVQKALQAAVDGTAKASSLADHVMELSSPEPAIETRVCDLQAVVDSAVQTMQPSINRHSIDLRVHAEPVAVAIDALALEQVLINLISNACQAMTDQAGKRRIVIESETTADQLVLSVRDTGPGIKPSIRENLFEPFVTTAQAGHEKGTGLGLNICRQLTEAAGGAIGLADSSEQGSCFRIELPLANGQG